MKKKKLVQVKKLNMNDILKESFEYNLINKNDEVYKLMNLSKVEKEILRKKHSTKKHVSWMTKRNDKYRSFLNKRRGLD